MLVNVPYGWGRVHVYVCAFLGVNINLLDLVSCTIGKPPMDLHFFLYMYRQTDNVQVGPTTEFWLLPYHEQLPNFEHIFLLPLSLYFLIFEVSGLDHIIFKSPPPIIF